jgi:hypothetical protein
MSACTLDREATQTAPIYAGATERFAFSATDTAAKHRCCSVQRAVVALVGQSAIKKGFRQGKGCLSACWFFFSVHAEAPARFL